MKKLFALAFVATSLVLVSCGSKETASNADTTATATVVADTTAKVAADTTTKVAADTTTKVEEVKK